jgi:HD-GYP domain-containing protein (c-di-GMP phosphodiesterase class II)
MPIEVALGRLHDSDGTQFDPQVVSALEHVLE